MKNKEELETLNKKFKRLKIINIVLILIVLIGVVGAGTLGYLYIRRDILKKTTIVHEMQFLKNKINEKYNNNYEYNENVHNAAYKLDLNVGESGLHATHPKILNFDEKWNGYKYWLVYSPYPFANDKYENPYLVASNDLINWETPKGLKNPIEKTPSNYKHEYIYNSDPHILYNADTKKMELYFRFVNDTEDKVIIYRRTSSDGVNWSEKEEIISNNRSKKDYMSPAIIYDNGIYKMWFVDHDKLVHYIESKDGYKYENEKVIDLNYPIPKLQSWHIDTIKTEKGYELLTVAYRYHEDRNSMNLYYFTSKDNENYSKGVIVMRPSLISWDNKGIYRSSFIYENGVYYVYYSGISMNNERGIGLAYGEHIENLIGSNIKQETDLVTVNKETNAS